MVVEFKGVEDQYKKIREDLKLYLTTKQYKSETTKLV
jgi:phosphomevalonate kinase